jgi:hypothetical protein
MQKKYKEPGKTTIILTTAIVFATSTGEGRRKKEEGRMHNGRMHNGRRSDKINAWGH